MINSRCANDIFGYCSDPPKPSKTVLSRGEVEIDSFGHCPKDQKTCGNYNTATELLGAQGREIAELAAAKKKNAAEERHLRRAAK